MRSALLAGRHRDGSGRLRHRQTVCAGSVVPAVEAGDEHLV